MALLERRHAPPASSTATRPCGSGKAHRFSPLHTRFPRLWHSRRRTSPPPSSQRGSAPDWWNPLDVSSTDGTKPPEGRPDRSEEVERAIESFRAGRNRDANFQVLFEVYYKPVRAFFSRRLPSPEASSDLTQETFLRVYKGLGGYRGDAPFGAWLFRIAANVLHRYRQGTNEDTWLDSDREAETAIAEGGDRNGRETGSALAKVLDRERRTQLRDAIDGLSDQRRQCLTLWVYHELTYEQIAAVMQLKLGTVKATLHQARKQVGLQLSEDEGGPPT